MKKNRISFLYAIVFCVAGLLCSCGKQEETEQQLLTDEPVVDWSISWQGWSCSGLYSGEMRNGLPHGYGEFDGKFIMDDGTEVHITYSGRWKKGYLQGEGKLVDYSEGVVYEGNFSENRMNGTVKVYKEEDIQTYEIRNYSKDVPCNVSWKCDSDGTYIGYDRYIWGNSVEDIFKSTVERSYQEFAYGLSKYDTVKLCCKVEDQYDKWEEKGEEDYPIRTVKVSDAKGNVYILTHDLQYRKRATNYMPVLKNGDEITVYGYYLGMDTYGASKLYYPYIEAVCAEWTKADNFDCKDMRYEYAYFLNYPYAYKDEEIQLNGKIVGINNMTEDRICFLVESDDYGGKKEIYICRVKNDSKSAAQFPGMGEQVSMKGQLKLNSTYISENGECVICPCVELTSFIQ